MKAITLSDITSISDVWKDKWYKLTEIRQFYDKFLIQDKKLINFIDKANVIFDILVEHSYSMFDKQNPEPNIRGQIHAQWLYNRECYVRDRFLSVWNRIIVNNNNFVELDKKQIIYQKKLEINSDFTY